MLEFPDEDLEYSDVTGDGAPEYWVAEHFLIGNPAFKRLACGFDDLEARRVEHYGAFKMRYAGHHLKWDKNAHGQYRGSPSPVLR